MKRNGETLALHGRERAQTSTGSSCLLLVSTDLKQRGFLLSTCCAKCDQAVVESSCHLKLCLQIHSTKSLSASRERDGEGGGGFQRAVVRIKGSGRGR